MAVSYQQQYFPSPDELEPLPLERMAEEGAEPIVATVEVVVIAPVI